MARFTASSAFNSATFDLSALMAAATSSLATGSFGLGLRSYENRLSVTDNTGPERARLEVLMDDAIEANGAITGGTIGNIQFDQGWGTASWSPAFRISAIEASAPQLHAALLSAGSTDDRAFLTAILAGDDTISLSVFADQMNAGSGNDTMDGSGGNDTLFGHHGNDSVTGALGHDVLFGGANDDRLWGSRGNDSLEGNEGIDQMWGGAGNDTLRGGNNADTIAGGAGTDLLHGGEGNDHFAFAAGERGDIIEDYDDLRDFFRVDVADPNNRVWTEEQQGADLLITVGDMSFTVLNCNASDINANDFVWI
jgi:Ca2+-binding RTX toxin-like protein